MKKLIAMLAVVVLAGCSEEPTPAPPAVPPPASVAPSLQRGIAIPGAFCREEGAKRLTEAGQVATCAHNGQRLRWTVTP